MLTFRQLQNLRVLTLAEGALLGKVVDFQFDLQQRSIYGFKIKGESFFQHLGVARPHVQRLGQDVMIVGERSQLQTLSKQPHGDGRAWASEYRDMELIDQGGESLGQVEDLELDLEQGILSLLISSGRRLILDESTRLGSDAVVVHDRTRIEPAEVSTRSRWSRWRSGGRPS